MTAQEIINIRLFLKAERYLNKNWSQNTLAKELLRNIQSVQHWEAGKTTIPDICADYLRGIYQDCIVEKSDRLFAELVKKNCIVPGDEIAFFEKLNNI